MNLSSMKRMHTRKKNKTSKMMRLYYHLIKRKEKAERVKTRTIKNTD